MILTTLVLGATLTLADLRKLVAVGQPEISPDATRVVVPIGRRDYDKNRIDTDLVLIDVKTARAAQTLARRPAFRICMVAERRRDRVRRRTVIRRRQARLQLFVLPMNGGEPFQLTHEKNGVRRLRLAPRRQDARVRRRTQAADAKALEHGENAFNVTEEAWTEQSPTATHELYEISASGGKSRRIGDGSVKVRGGFTYAADGNSIFVTRLNPGASPNQYLATQHREYARARRSCHGVAAAFADAGRPDPFPRRYAPRLRLHESARLDARRDRRGKRRRASAAVGIAIARP